MDDDTHHYVTHKCIGGQQLYSVTKLDPCICALTFSKTGDLNDIYLGTAFLISADMAVTAAHNICDKNGVLYKHFRLYPGLNGKVVKSTKIHTISHTRDKKPQVFIHQRYYRGQKPHQRNYDFAFIKLASPHIVKEGYLKIGTNVDDYSKEKLDIVGYPTSKCKTNPEKTELQSALQYHCQGYGKILKQVKPTDRTFDYCISTEEGQSGCPIICERQDGRYVVGLHNGGVKDQEANSGRLFTQDLSIMVNLWREKHQCQNEQVFHLSSSHLLPSPIMMGQVLAEFLLSESRLVQTVKEMSEKVEKLGKSAEQAKELRRITKDQQYIIEKQDKSYSKSFKSGKFKQKSYNYRTGDYKNQKALVKQASHEQNQFNQFNQAALQKEEEVDDAFYQAFNQNRFQRIKKRFPNQPESVYDMVSPQIEKFLREQNCTQLETPDTPDETQQPFERNNINRQQVPITNLSIHQSQLKPQPLLWIHQSEKSSYHTQDRVVIKHQGLANQNRFVFTNRPLRDMQVVTVLVSKLTNPKKSEYLIGIGIKPQNLEQRTQPLVSYHYRYKASDKKGCFFKDQVIINQQSKNHALKEGQTVSIQLQKEQGTVVFKLNNQKCKQPIQLLINKQALAQDFYIFTSMKQEGDRLQILEI